MIKLISIYVELESGKCIDMEAMLSDISPDMRAIIEAYANKMEKHDAVLELVMGKQREEGENWGSHA